MSWCDDVVVGFDVESTSPNPLEARIVSASVVIVEPGEQPVVHDWLVAVDGPIPAEATAIHGISTAQARADGEPLGKVVMEVYGLLTAVWEDHHPVCAMNLPYDATVLNQERERCGMRPITYSETATPVLDPLVIDRKLDKFRKGSRKLVDMCKHYGVTLDNAHTSAADAIAAVEVMLKLVEAFPQLRRRSLQELYWLQQEWYAQWASNYQDYKRRTTAAEGGNPSDIVVDQSWPVRIPVEEPLPVGDR